MTTTDAAAGPLHWAFVDEFDEGLPSTVSLEGGVVTLERPGQPPARRPIAEAFAAPHLVFVRDPMVRLELFAAIAGRLDPAALATPALRVRRRFSLAYDPSRLRARPMAFVHEAGSDRGVEALTLDAYGAVVREPVWVGSVPWLPDELFVHGPPQPGAPRALRDRLRRALLGALRDGHDLTAADAFPTLDHAAMTPRSWSWDEDPRGGGSWAKVRAGRVAVGYQHERDVGEAAFSPENVATGDPRVRLGDLPSEIATELVDEVRRAVVAPAAVPSPREALGASLELRRRVVDRAPWSRSLTLVYELPEATEWGEAWGLDVATDLFGSLRADAHLGADAVIIDAARGRAYDLGEDRAWLGPEGAGIVAARARADAAGGDGFDEVFHVAPDANRRVVFAAAHARDSGAFEVVLSTNEGASLVRLREHVEAYFGAFGLETAAVREGAPRGRRQALG